MSSPIIVTKHIIYAYTNFGYTVQVMEGDKVIEEYNFGNHAKDSTVTVPLNDPNALSPRLIKRFARDTSYDLARNRGIPRDLVEFDGDLEETLKEIDRQRENS